MSEEHAQAEAGVPEYMVSYADMLTIMLAFFVVLYASTSASGTRDKGGKSGEDARGGKEPAAAAGINGQETGRDLAGPEAGNDPRLQQVFESLYDRFGPDYSLRNWWPGRSRGPVNSIPNDEGRRIPTRPPRFLPSDDYTVLVSPKSLDNVVAGGCISFPGFSVSLDPDQRKTLRALAEQLAGKLQKIEIRGHTSRRPLPKGSPYKDYWDLAYARARSVEQDLVAQGIDPARIRLSVAGANEPMELAGNGPAVDHNGRVEIRLLNEWLKSPGQAKAAPSARPAALGIRPE